MRRRTTIRVGILSCVMIGTVALGGIGSPSSASPGAAEFHAPRIPGPTPVPVPTPAFHANVSVVQSWTSLNWSGYALTGTSISNVVGNWKVPQVQTPTTKKKKARYSSSWVGIDGFNNAHLIQAGTEQDWVHGTKFYRAWWEILPAAETPITSLLIHPGDAMSVSITEGVSPTWTIQVSDTTTNQTFTIVKSYSGPRTSAEWIQEAPTIGRHVAMLAPDTNVVFDHGKLNLANPGLISAEAGAMFKAGLQISTPSAPNPNQDGFAVAYGRVAPPAPSS
jgi:hypothetical protein